jgi:hypothetical protein
MKETFTWLPNSIRKQVPYLPRVICDTGNFGGYYYKPSKERPLGEIAINPDYPDHIKSALAHEFRHHWQVFNYGTTPRGVCWNKLSNKFDYETAIFHYFSKIGEEMDALICEYKHAKNDVNEWWLKKILDRNI